MSDLRTRAAAAANPEVQRATEDALRNPSPDTIGAAIEAAVAAQSVPDLADSGIDPSQDVPAHVAWSRVMGEVQWIAKASQADKYKFRGIDAVRNAVGPALRKHGVVVVPVATRIEHERHTRSGGGSMTTSRATVTYAIFGPRGDRLGGPGFTMETLGEGFDVGDKSSMKAQSVAERTLYITGLCIPTDQPELDPEHGPQYEIATPKPPTAEEYYAEILSPGVSFARLQTINGELAQHRDIATTMMRNVDGSEERLIDVLFRIAKGHGDNPNKALPKNKL
jgi:hypothetical protein